jgi:hypothetical protein
MDQAIIDEVVAKVVARVRVKMATAVSPQRVLMLFSGASTGYVVGMETIRLLNQANHNLTVFMTASAIHVVGEENVRRAGAAEIIGPDSWVNTPGLVRETDLVLVPTLSMNTAARLALGLMDSLFSTLVLGALLDNKPVIAVCDGADPYGNGGLIFSDTYTGSPALRQRMAGHLGTLIEYGIDLVREEEFITAVLRHFQPTPAAPAPVQGAVVSVGGGNGRYSPILTAADLIAYPPGTTLRLPAGTRLTPLAQDTARRQSLCLFFEGER